MRATQAMVVTNLAASMGGLTWLLLDWRIERKWSGARHSLPFVRSVLSDRRYGETHAAVGFCSGAIAGLVAITPGSGYVGSYP